MHNRRSARLRTAGHEVEDQVGPGLGLQKRPIFLVLLELQRVVAHNQLRCYPSCRRDAELVAIYGNR
jgi:hypothetical protein